MTAAPSSRVVFVEPDGPQTDHFRQLLQFEGFDVLECAAGDLHGLAGLAPHVLILNLARLRNAAVDAVRASGRDARRPLTLALVAAGEERRGVELVESGIDGYLTLACGAREFVARVRAMLRRAHLAPTASIDGTASAQAVRMPCLEIDPARRRVRAGDSELRLTEQEFQLLYFLAGHPGRVFDRQALLDAVWGADTFVTVRSVDALVKRLRHQLRPVLPGACMVETVRGVGYRLTEPTAGGASAA